MCRNINNDTLEAIFFTLSTTLRNRDIAEIRHGSGHKKQLSLTTNY